MNVKKTVVYLQLISATWHIENSKNNERWYYCRSTSLKSTSFWSMQYVSFWSIFKKHCRMMRLPGREKVWWYCYLFGYNTRVWRTDRRTDRHTTTASTERIASRGQGKRKKRPKATIEWLKTLDGNDITQLWCEAEDWIYFCVRSCMSFRAASLKFSACRPYCRLAVVLIKQKWPGNFGSSNLHNLVVISWNSQEAPKRTISK